MQEVSPDTSVLEINRPGKRPIKITPKMENYSQQIHKVEKKVTARQKKIDDHINHPNLLLENQTTTAEYQMKIEE